MQNGVGQPIEGATVELWRPMERAAIRRTGADGAFRFGEAKSAGASALYVARIGFAPLRIAIAPGATGLRLVLTEERLPLPELVVETASHVCPTEESREAVALWCAASVGHVPVEGATFLSGRYIGATGKVEIGEAGGGRSAPNPTWGYVGSAGSKQAEWRERIRAEGYAWPISASGVDGRYEAWENPRLDADLADPLFFELHTLSMVRADEDGWVLGFCPRSRHGNRPVIEGTAALARDTTFASAEWPFRTRERFLENAGGKVNFAPRDRGAAPSYLLPIEGRYWRETPGRGRFFQNGRRYETWEGKRS